MPKERDIVAWLFKTFINSLKPRQFSGTIMGKDYMGNKYYEIPANPSAGRRKTARWFEPQEKEKFDQELPAEWESWLRYRRKHPPTEEEILKNVETALLKKKNAAEIDKKFKWVESTKPAHASLKTGYPTYEEYETSPGERKKPKV